MRFAMSSSPHIRCSDNTRRIMLDVLIALLPTLLAGTIFFGLRCLLLAAVSIAAAGLAEALWNKLTRRYQTVEDLSAAVTGLLLVLTLPATVPYWMAAVGAVFAVIVVKAAFGGLGQNIFNPALAARALLLLLFPASMTRFVAPGTSIPLDLRSADVVTAATPLHSMVMPALPDVPLSEMFLGSIGGCIGEVSALALLIGGGYLVVRGVIKLRIPVSYLGTMAVLSFAFAPMEPLRWMLYSLLGGGVLLGALFMASDYATSPATPGGQVLYGIGCGVLTVLFRSVGLYPEGVTYAILLMNAASWLLERFTRNGKEAFDEGKRAACQCRFPAACRPDPGSGWECRGSRRGRKRRSGATGDDGDPASRKHGLHPGRGHGDRCQYYGRLERGRRLDHRDHCGRLCRPHPPVDRCGQQWPCNRSGGPGHGGDLRPGPERIDGH